MPVPLLDPPPGLIAACADAGGAWLPRVMLLGQETGGAMQIIFSGGWVGMSILLVLVALSITATYLVFDQVMTLRRDEVVPHGLSEAVRQSLLTARLNEADAACRRQPSVLAFVLHHGLSELEFGWHQIEKAVEDALAEQSSRLMRRIEYLSVIGNIAPMVGLLGTVTGMIFAFREVAGSQGGAGAGDLAEGIYQALVTTVGGLIVAIPSLAAFAVFRNRVDGLIAEAAYQAQHALAPAKRRPGTRRGAAAAGMKSPPPTGPLPPTASSGRGRPSPAAESPSQSATLPADDSGATPPPTPPPPDSSPPASTPPASKPPASKSPVSPPSKRRPPQA